MEFAAPFLFCVVLPIVLLAWATVRAQDREAIALLRNGLVAEADVIAYAITDDGPQVTYAFLPRGSDVPVVCEKRARRRARAMVGGKATVRYMAKYPSLSVLVSRGRAVSLP